MSKDAYYFSHDSNAKDDPKCVLLIEQLGLEGYGIFWILIETLREQPGYKYPLVLLPALSRRFNTTFEKMKAVVTKYNLFQIEGNEFFFSHSLNERMNKLDSKRESNRIAGQISAANKKRKLLELSMKASQDLTHVEQMLNIGITNDEPLKNSKEEESKEEEVKYIFNFRNALIDLGIEKQIVDDWLKVRKTKKATNTETAFDLIKKQIEKSGLTANECIKISVQNSWSGFKSEWIKDSIPEIKPEAFNPSFKPFKV